MNVDYITILLIKTNIYSTRQIYVRTHMTSSPVSLCLYNKSPETDAFTLSPHIFILKVNYYDLLVELYYCMIYIDT